ncbi:MAG: MTAP family purine nucleoside phosphorylase [Phycisphaerae bacterium]
MSGAFACIAGEEIYRLIETGRLQPERLGQKQTPYGLSGEIFLADAGRHPFYLLARFKENQAKTSPRKINSRANIYALKDLGVGSILGWGPAGAITHSFMLNDLALIGDVIDMTYLRETTFFEDSPFGYLRQFPVFCQPLRRRLADVLDRMGLAYHDQALAAVKEGPRLETPAEIKVLAGLDAEVVTHTLVPEMFLAKELQICYSGVCYIVNYAETGSRHRPFETGGLFGSVHRFAHGRQYDSVNASLDEIARALAEALAMGQEPCECAKAMQAMREQFDLSADWKSWLSPER